MFSHLTQFQLNAILVACFLLLHGMGAKAFVDVMNERGRAIGRGGWIWIVVGIVLLDIPLIYLQLVYKSYHPLVVDQILYAIWLPWALLQFNLLLFCTTIAAYRFGARPLLRRKAKMRMERRELTGETSKEIGTDRSPTLHLNETIRAVPELMERRELKRQIIDERNMNSMKNTNKRKREREQDYPALDNSGSQKGEGSLYHRRRFLQTSAFALGGVALNGSLLLAANGEKENTIERIVVQMPNLPEGLKGTTIAMISDIHSSLFMSRKTMEYYAKIVQSLKADLIVVPGDFVNSRVGEVYPFAEAFSQLSAPLGVYGVTGNHDYYTREIETVAREVEDAGITLLRNENVRIEKDGVSLRLLGMDDNAIYDVREYIREGKTVAGRIENLLKGIEDAEPTIFLCHKPYPFEEYAQLGIDLTLSGHTHGGQIVLGKLDAMNVSMASLASTYIAGLYKARSNPESQMYISRGVGTVGLPVRINCPPEVAHITLV